MFFNYHVKADAEAAIPQLRLRRYNGAIAMVIAAFVLVTLGISVAGLYADASLPVSGTPQSKLNTGLLVTDNGPVTVELAETAEEQRQGLSFRAGLGKNEGMLFVYPEAEPQTFWMYGMKFPIDIVFLRNNKVISIADRVPPPTRTSGIPWVIRAAEDADMVLELPAGRAIELELLPGATVKLLRR
jgi:uncharacterized membrane protein (UPF0127 family)